MLFLLNALQGLSGSQLVSEPSVNLIDWPERSTQHRCSSDPEELSTSIYAEELIGFWTDIRYSDVLCHLKCCGIIKTYWINFTIVGM